MHMVTKVVGSRTDSPMLRVDFVRMSASLLKALRKYERPPVSVVVREGTPVWLTPVASLSYMSSTSEWMDDHGNNC